MCLPIWRLHQKLFYRPLLSAVARIPGEEARLSPEAARDRLKALGYADPSAALRHLDKGGCVVCAGIHMSDIPAFPYSILWGERSVRSVANLTRRDGAEFLELASRIPLHTSVETFALARANEALQRLRHGQLQGAAVLLPHG